LERTAGIELCAFRMSARGISALNAREAPGCPRRLARCVAMWCDAQRRVVERCEAPREVPRRAALPTVMSISPTRLIDQANMAGRGATSRQHCCRSRHLFRSRRKSKRSPDEPTGRREAPPDDRLRDIRGSLLNLQAPHVAPLIRATLLPAYAGSPLSDKICAAPPMARRKASSKVTPRSCHRCGRPCHAICHSVAHPSS